MQEKTKDILEWIYCIVIALVLAMLFRYFIGTPTIVKQVSMTKIFDDKKFKFYLKSIYSKGNLGI